MLFLPSLIKFRGPQSIFLAEATLGAIWPLLWFKYASDPKESLSSSLSVNKKLDKKLVSTPEIPWLKILTSFPVWAIVVNNFTFHYALYVLMNWLPTYFELGLQLSLQDMGSSKTRRILSVTKTRKFLNTMGFLVASLSLIVIPSFRTSGGAVFCSSVALGFLALGRAGFTVNHMDVAPRYAGIVMGVSNTAGTLDGIVGVDLIGKLLEAAKASDSDLSSPESWRCVSHS
ncbi:hypothetical protein RJT34_27502 [Clitoria ternatea]|uniref:Uncharacterized protein n=1 Tax=Clitoria ternatea TaxID=43366 RepID=A0AAN9FCZ5_CLITE